MKENRLACIYNGLTYLCSIVLVLLMLRAVVVGSNLLQWMAIGVVGCLSTLALFITEEGRNNLHDESYRSVEVALLASAIVLTSISTSLSRPAWPLGVGILALGLVLQILAAFVHMRRILVASKAEREQEAPLAEPKTFVVIVSDTGGYRDKPMHLLVNPETKTAEIISDAPIEEAGLRRMRKAVKLVLKSRSFVRRAFFVVSD